MVRHAITAKEGQVHEINIGGQTRLHGIYFANGLPLVNARLLLGGTDSTFGAMKMYATTNEKGEFDFFGAPPGHWTIYRQYDSRGSEWTKVRDVDVPADGDLDVGKIEHKIGFLKVKCTTNADALPERMQLRIQEYSDDFFGRTAAQVMPRESPHDPFVIQQVAPGDYHLVSSGFGDYQIFQRVKVTDETINTTVPFDIPKGKATVTARVADDDGKPLSQYLMTYSEDWRMMFNMNVEKDSDGNPISVAKNVPDGKYLIRNGNASTAPIVARIEVTDDKDQTVDISLSEKDKKRRGYASLLTVDQQGAVLPCSIRVRKPKTKAPKVMIRTNSFTETSLVGPVGEYECEISHPGFETVIKNVELKRDIGADSTHVVMKSQ